MLIPKFQNKAYYVSYIFASNFTLVTIPGFSFKRKFFFINDISLYDFKTSLKERFYNRILIFSLTHHLYNVRAKLKST